VKSFLRALLVLLVLGAAGTVALVYSISLRGIGTRTSPSPAEAFLSRSMRYLATPRGVRSMVNPVEPTRAVIEEGLEHFADHCAVCHANTGSGETEMGRALYPPAPDMRAAPTQALSDGELFSIIENGIRLTGMPAWGTGTAEGERASWVLVDFIRHLPSLTDEEAERMEALNPKSADEWRQEEEIRRFLAGEDVKVPEAAPHAHGEAPQ